jgi:hypothetical protein
MMPGKLKQWAEVHTVLADRHKPVVFDVGIHFAYALKYVIYGTMGLAGAIVGLPALARTTDALFSTIICTLLAIVAYGTAVIVVMPKKQELEVYATILMMVLLGVLGVALLLRFRDTGDDGYLYLCVGSLSFIVFPFYRSAFIAVRIRAARKAEGARKKQAQLMRQLDQEEGE